MPTRGLMLPTREIGPRLSHKSKSLASSIACAAACVAGRFRMIVSNGRGRVGETMRRGITRSLIPSVCVESISLSSSPPKLSRVWPGSLLPMLFEIEVLPTWVRELRLEYEVGL